MMDLLFYTSMAIIVVLVIFAIVSYDESESFNMHLYSDWPQYSRRPRSSYDPTNVIQETIPYLRSGQPFQYQQIVAQDARCFANSDACERATTIMNKQLEFLDTTQGGIDVRSPHELRWTNSERFHPTKLQIRSGQPEGFTSAREDSVINGQREVYTEYQSGDRQITGSNAEFASWPANTIGAINASSWNPLTAKSADLCREGTGIIWSHLEPECDVERLPQRHPTMLHEKHRISTQVNNHLLGTEVRKNLEKTLIADAIRCREIPPEFGGA